VVSVVPWVVGQLWRGIDGVMGVHCPPAFGTWAIFPQLREISLTIDLDASHYLHTIVQFVVMARRRHAKSFALSIFELAILNL